jgi:hypothetical protein
VQTLLPGFDDVKASRDKLERTAKTTAYVVGAVEQDLQNKAREGKLSGDFECYR